MVDVPITIACGNYDRTSAIRDGRVKVEGCAVNLSAALSRRRFSTAPSSYQEFDVSELSFSSYIRTVAAGTSAYVGIPAFVSRHVPPFRHLYPQRCRHRARPPTCAASASACRNIRSPPWSGCAACMQHEYGVQPNDIHWRNGGQEQAGAASARRSSRFQASTCSRSARTRRWSACCATASSMRCSRRARRRRSSRRAAYQAAVRRYARRPSRPITRRPACSRSCTWSASARRW